MLILLLTLTASFFSTSQHEFLPLDATVIDVYAGAHAVLFLVGKS